MSLHITDDCINCGACEATCPTGAISEHPEKSIRVIDSERCTECVGFYHRTMCQIECPVECCVENPDRRETKEDLAKKARNLFLEHGCLSAANTRSEHGDAGVGQRQARRTA